MLNVKSGLLSLILFISMSAFSQNRVLVFSKTAGFRHSSIDVAKIAIQKLGSQNGFSVDTTEDAKAFTEINLKKYSAVVFLSSTGDVLNDYLPKIRNNNSQKEYYLTDLNVQQMT